MAAPLFYGAMHYEHQTPSPTTLECSDCNLTYMDGIEMRKGAIKLRAVCTTRAVSNVASVMAVGQLIILLCLYLVLF